MIGLRQLSILVTFFVIFPCTTYANRAYRQLENPLNLPVSLIECDDLLAGLGDGSANDEALWRTNNLFQAGLDHEAEGVGYIALSQRQLKRLANNGELSGERLDLRLISSRVPLDLLQAKMPGLYISSTNDDALRDCSFDAYELSLAELTIERFQRAGYNLTLGVPAMKAFLWKVASEKRSPSSRRDAKHFSLTRQQIKWALEKAVYDYAERFGFSDDRSGDHPSSAQMFQVFGALGLTSREFHPDTDGGWVELSRLLAKLPMKAGAVAVLSPSVLESLNEDEQGTPSVMKISLSDLLGIEPQSDDEYEFLNNLTQKQK